MSRSEIDEYLGAVGEPARATLTRLRETIVAIVPDAEQCISYGMPAFKLRGKTIAAGGSDRRGVRRGGSARP